MDLLKKISNHLFEFQAKQLREPLQLVFLKRLTELLESGHSFLASLEALTYEKRFRPTVAVIIQSLKAGEAIDLAFQRASFHRSITSYLYFIRLSGDLEESMKRCVQIMEQRLHYRDKLITVIRYPILLFFIFVILLFFVKRSIFPSFEQLFQANAQSFASIERTIYIINLLMNGSFLFILFACMIPVVWMLTRNKLTITQQITILKNIPFYRSIKSMQISFTFAMNTHMYLTAGLSLRQVLEHLSAQERMPIIAHYASLLLQQLMNGLPVAQMLLQLDFIDKQIADAFEKESEIAISNHLHGYAIYISDKLHEYVMKWITFIQPLFFGILACLIIFVYMSLLYPMFEFIQNI